MLPKQSQTTLDESEMAALSERSMYVKEVSNSQYLENHYSKSTDCRFNTSQVKCTPVNVEEPVTTVKIRKKHVRRLKETFIQVQKLDSL